MASGTGASQVIAYSPNPNYFGSDSFVIQVSDGGSTDTVQIDVNISARNDSPVMDPIANQSGSEDILVTVTPVVADPDDLNDGSGALTWSILVASNPAWRLPILVCLPGHRQLRTRHNLANLIR